MQYCLWILYFLHNTASVRYFTVERKWINIYSKSNKSNNWSPPDQIMSDPITCKVIYSVPSQRNAVNFTDYSPPLHVWFTINTSPQLRKTIHISLLMVTISRTVSFFLFFLADYLSLLIAEFRQQTLMYAVHYNKINFIHSNNIHPVCKKWAISAVKVWCENKEL